jgi:hypothetical protein
MDNIYFQAVNQALSKEKANDLVRIYWDGPFVVCVEGQECPDEWWSDIQNAMTHAAELAKQYPGKKIRTFRHINTSVAETVVRVVEA